MLILVGCANVEPLPSGLINTKQNTNTTFQKILDGTKVTGSILIYDRDKSEMHSNDFERAMRGDSKISQMEQVDFWSRFYDGHLSISPRTDSLTKKMTLLRDWDQYKLWGKTGWAASSDRNIGWFVGMLEAKGTCLS